MEIMVAIALFILLDVAAWRWAVDSRFWDVDDRAIRARPRRAI